MRKPQALSKIVIYQFRHNCVKPKNDEKVKCLIWIKTVSVKTL